tara:strand:- start:770 stop:943 length:174 start_codon:yes stop_codon:yes gene_type:complete
MISGDKINPRSPKELDIIIKHSKVAIVLLILYLSILILQIQLLIGLIVIESTNAIKK